MLFLFLKWSLSFSSLWKGLGIVSCCGFPIYIYMGTRTYSIGNISHYFLNSFKSSSNTNAIIILCQSALQNFKIAYFFWQWPLQNKKAWILYSNWWTTIFDFPKFINPWKWLWVETSLKWILDQISTRTIGTMNYM